MFAENCPSLLRDSGCKPQSSVKTEINHTEGSFGWTVYYGLSRRKWEQGEATLSRTGAYAPVPCRYRLETPLNALARYFAQDFRMTIVRSNQHLQKGPHLECGYLGVRPTSSYQPRTGE